MNAASAFVFTVVVIGFILALRYLYKSHRDALSGKAGCACSGGCAGCSGSSSCAGSAFPPLAGTRKKPSAGQL